MCAMWAPTVLVVGVDGVLCVQSGPERDSAGREVTEREGFSGERGGVAAEEVSSGDEGSEHGVPRKTRLAPPEQGQTQRRDDRI